MSISKEIFGIERKKPYTPAISGPGIDNTQFNNCLDIIDQYELSEEELANIINHIDSECRECGMASTNSIAKAIKQNQSKIFVKKTK